MLVVADLTGALHLLRAPVVTSATSIVCCLRRVRNGLSF